MFWWAAARADDLPSVATRDGTLAVHDALQGLVRDTRPKKLAEALAAAGLSAVTMPVTPGLGADLVIRSAGPLGGCTWGDGAVACVVPLQTTAVVADGEYQLSCRSRMGATVPLPASLAPGATAERAELLVPDVLPCWKLDGAALVVTPVSGVELEGVGLGTDLIPPELVGLSKRQVEETIGQHTGAFRHCLVSKGGPGHHREARGGLPHRGRRQAGRGRGGVVHARRPRGRGVYPGAVPRHHVPAAERWVRPRVLADHVPVRVVAPRGTAGVTPPR
jgi:hypothetical protein